MDTKPSTQSVFKGFEGFSAPNTTPVPDVVFDVLAPDLGEAELRVLLYIIRRTFGFKKATDTISLGQMVHGIVRRDGTVLDRGTGLTKSGVTKALRGLLAKGVISARQNRSPEKGNEPTTYTLRFKTPLSTGEDKGLSTGEDKPLSSGVDTQDTVIQETVLQSNSSKHDENKKVEDPNDIKTVWTASEPIIEQQFVNTSPLTVGDVPQQARPRSEVMSIGDVLKRRAQILEQASSPPSATPTPTDQGPLGPSPDRGVAIAPDDGQEGDSSPTGAARAASGSTVHPGRRRVQPSLQIDAIITQFSREFHDEEHLRPNINQAARLWKASGRAEQSFCQFLFDAASATRKRDGIRNRMAYYFQVLRGLIEPNQS